MKIINSECWDVIDSGTKTIKFNGNKSGDTVASELYLNPLSDCEIVVKGFVTPDDNDGIELSAIDVADLSKKTSVDAAGNYMYMVSSYYKVDISVTGSSKVLVKYLF